MQQYAFQLLRIDFYIQLWSIDGQGNVFPGFSLNLVHDSLAEGGDVLLLHFVRFGQGVLQFGQFLDVVGECMQGLYSRQRSVERVQCRFHLGGDVLDEFCFQFVVLVGDTDGFLLLAGKDDEAQQYDSTEYQDCGKDGSQYAESDDDVLLGAQGVVLLLDGGQAFIVLLLQDVQFVLCGKRFHGVGPEDILVVCTSHQSGIVCLAGNADESLVAFVYLGEDLVTYEMVTPNTVLLQDIGFGGSDHTIDVLPGYNKVTVKAINNVFDELVDDEGFDVSDMYGSFTNLTDKRNDNKYYKVENVQGLTLERWESIAYGDNGEISQDAIPVMGANLNYNMTGGMTAYRVGEADIDFKGWDGLTPLYTIISENYTWRSLLRYRIISTAVGNPILRVGGVTAVYKDAAIGISADILFTTNYAEPNKVTITEDHVLRFKLRIGDHYWNGNKWQNSETTFTIGIGEVGEEVERTKLRATKKADMPYEGLTGYVIEFPDSVPLTGKFELILYGTDYPYQNDKYIKVVDIENLRVAYKKKDGVTDEGENGDRVYENVVNEKFMSELDEIEFGISSYNEDGATYSKALLNGNFLTNNLYSAIEGTLVRPEEALIRRIINRYRVTKIKLTQVLKNSDLIHPFTVLYDNSMVSKKFMLLSGVWDYEQNTVTLSMIENGDKVRYKNHK